MSTLNSVEIKKVKVTPLSEWTFLLNRSATTECAWPEKSNYLCWWCASSFTNVPAFLPVKVDINVGKKEGQCVFTGNFCSWNCVKRYAMHLEEHKKVPTGCFYIGLLAYLTASKPLTCDDDTTHDLGLCDCIDKYKGVGFPMGREVLTSFGGTVTIDEYRRDFHIIHDYESVRRNFKEVGDITRLKERALNCKNVKFWGFHYLNYAGPDASYTTFVNILPLTNRTFAKQTLVTTGNETSGADTNALTGKEGGGGGKPKQKSAPRASKVNHRSRSNKTSQPVALSSIQTCSTTKEKEEQPLPINAGPLYQAFKQTSKPIMTSEQVLACNDEQQFYTNSLRGYGNILTSMGIDVTRPPPQRNNF